MSSSKPIIGWREWVRLVDLGGALVKTKVDTGARTSALHAFALEELERDGIPLARFEVHPVQRRSTPSIAAEIPITEWREIRNSGGKVERRPVVTTTIQLGESRFPIDITLTRRDEMGFRMLLGRHAVRRRFLVDPGRSFRMGKPEGAS